MRTTNYYLLFFKDAALKKALLNIFLFPALIAFLFCVVLYIAKRLINRKYHIKYINAVFYGATSVFTTACMYFQFKGFFAYPAYTYPLAAVLQAEPGIGSNFNLFLLCLQAAILLCFIFWCIDLVSEKINGRK